MPYRSNTLSVTRGRSAQFYVLNSQMLYIAYIPLPVTSAITSHEARALTRVFDKCRMGPVRYSPCAASSPKNPSGARPRTWKSLSKGLASESNRASCCRTSLEWTNYIHVCIYISATVPSTQDLYFLEAEVLEPAVARFVLVFPSFASPVFVSAGFRKRSTAFHGATSFDS